MSTAWIVGGLLLVGIGMVSSQLFRLKDWLARQPPPAPPEDADETGAPGVPGEPPPAPD